MRLKIKVLFGETEENYEFPHNQRCNILDLNTVVFINRISYMFRLTNSHNRADRKIDIMFTHAAVKIFL
jgi:hypothetical protein